MLAGVERLLSSHEGEALRAPFRRPADTLSRDLRLARDYLQLACAEISAMCWVVEGQDDLRQPAATHRRGALSPADTNSRCGTAPRHIDLRQHVRAQ